MKVFVTGAGGQLGYDVIREVKRRGYYSIGSDITKIAEPLSDEMVHLDITDIDEVKRVLEEKRPDVVIHCAAWTAVDLAEEADMLPKAYEINVNGTKNIANVCRNLDCKMIYISTDYVFSGEGDTPWLPESTETIPVNTYGKTKLAGEHIVSDLLDKYFIVRVSWLFGRNGGNFVKTMLNIGRKNDVIRVVADQFGTPTYTVDLARLLLDMAEGDKYGYYHASNEGGYISWFQFACEIFKQAQYETEVIPVSTAEYGLNKAKRPLNSRLDKHKLSVMGFTLLPSWQDALLRYLKETNDGKDSCN